MAVPLRWKHVLHACIESKVRIENLGVDGIPGQLLLITKVDPQCLVIVDTNVLAAYELSTFFAWSMLTHCRPHDILRGKIYIHSHETV